MQTLEWVTKSQQDPEFEISGSINNVTYSRLDEVELATSSPSSM